MLRSISYKRLPFKLDIEAWNARIRPCLVLMAEFGAPMADEVFSNSFSLTVRDLSYKRKKERGRYRNGHVR